MRILDSMKMEKMSQKALERKSNKPIMEKKRRARINHCLNQLKALILETDSERSRHSKLEKADILEMTVRYLQTLRTYHLHLQQIHQLQTTTAAASQQQAQPPQQQPLSLAQLTGSQNSLNLSHLASLTGGLQQQQQQQHNSINANQLLNPHFQGPMHFSSNPSPQSLSPVSVASSTTSCSSSNQQTSVRSPIHPMHSHHGPTNNLQLLELPLQLQTHSRRQPQPQSPTWRPW